MNLSFLTSVVLTLLLYASSFAARAQSTYSLTQIEADEAELAASDINNQGDVVGTLSLASGNVDAFLWRDGVLTDLPDLMNGASPYSEALGINNPGDVVGVSLSTEFPGVRGFLFSDGEISDVGAPAGAAHFFAWDINEQGLIIGDATLESGLGRAYLRELTGAFVALEPLPGAEFTGVEEINARGDVVGFSDSDIGRRAVIWRDGAVASLGVLPGTSVSHAEGINDPGQVIGFASPNNFATRHAFLWDQGELLALPPVGSDESASTTANDINNRGQIVGTTLVSREPEPVLAIPTLWENLVAHDLNELIRDDDPLEPFVTLATADLINDGGQIVARGFDSRDPILLRTYLLTPTP